MIYRALALIFLFASVSAGAVQPSPSGQLEVIVALADSPRYLHTWVSTPPEKAVPVPRLRTLKPDQVGYAAFIVTGIEGDQQGDYSYSVSWKLLGPGGKLVHAYPGYAKGAGKLHHRPSFYMADPALDIILEHSDPAGEYVLEATAVDQVSGKKATGSYQIQFKK